MRHKDAYRPGERPGADRLARARERLSRAPLGIKVAVALGAAPLLIALLPIVAVVAIGYAVLAVIEGRLSRLASAAVALTACTALIFATGGWPHPLLLLIPWVIALVAHLGVLGRWNVPCRTVAWVALWSLAAGYLMIRLFPEQARVGVMVAWAIALLVLGWRFAKAVQAARMYGRQAAGGVAAPAGAHQVRVGGRSSASAYDDGYDAEAERYAEDQPEPPQISVEEALAELENMIGLEPVKEQVRSIAASIEAARMRVEAGYTTEKPMRHFVFVGPSGTGKTTVARVIAKIFYAFGLLDTPYVIEAQRADLVGEFLGATAIKTNELVDRALGGVLFIDEAYSLVNSGDGQPDRFGNEAVQTLLKRAEDDRDRLVIILAGYDKQMEQFLASNPGLASRFGTRIRFPSYPPVELVQIAEHRLAQRGDRLDPDARPVLWKVFEDVYRRGIVDELGNGRFVRSLVEKAAEARDVRVVGAGGEPASTELVTLRAGDVERAFAELTARFRGYADTPTVEAALAELDRLIGLEPVKRQVHALAAQLHVAKMRQRQGLVSQATMRHFVFLGPPGTGKTTVARILGRIFAALGLLARPAVVEAQRADLVGEHLGSTAIKTNKLIDSALGGVLFIDEAYALYNEGYSGGDAFGAEAVQTLLKRAEDDRERLVIILAGYSADMERFLATNPGLASRFGTRIVFPSYSAAELAEIAEMIADQAGDVFDEEARTDLDEIFRYVCAEGWIDALGNGRFARSLFERACAFRDLRVSRLGEGATATDLTTVTSADVRAAYQELTAAAPGG